MEETKAKKYEDLEEKAKIIRGVGEKILGLIGTNVQSIKWYENRIEEILTLNSEADVNYLREMISQLYKENELIAELEKSFWAKYVF